MQIVTRILAAVLTLAFMAAPVAAGPATDALKAPIDKGLALLKDPQYDPPEMKQAQRDEMWNIIREAFDFSEISKRAVARKWRGFTAQQKTDFIDAFANLLGNTYIGRIQEAYQGEEVVFVAEEAMSKNKAKVRTSIPREGGELLVDYSVKLIKGQWRVYDVNVEGVSLVKNYRTQFRQFLAKKSADDLIQRLKDKVEQQND